MPKANPSKFSSKKSDGAVVVTANGSVDEMAFACAAQAMIGRAHVALGKNSVWLLPKLSINLARTKSVDNFAKEFEGHYHEQAALWRDLRARKKDREARLESLLALAAPAAPSAEADFGELSPERKAEIAALLAEPPIDDKFGIARTWQETRTRRRAL